MESYKLEELRLCQCAFLHLLQLSAPATTASTVLLIPAILLILNNDIHLRYAADEERRKPILPLRDTHVLHGIALH